MVPKSDYITSATAARASQEEAEARASEVTHLEEQLARMKEQLRAARADATRFQVAMDEMVPRSELVAALAEARTGRDEAAAGAAAKLALEEHLARLQRQLRDAQSAAAAQMRATLDDTVPKAELLAARSRTEEAEAMMRQQQERQNEMLESLKERLAALQRENDKLTSTLQVRRARGFPVELQVSWLRLTLMHAFSGFGPSFGPHRSNCGAECRERGG